MKCSKCNRENLDDSNFCRFCSEPLKKKCPECGEMELIGKNVCLTKVRNIKGQAEIFAKQKITFDKKMKLLCIAWGITLSLSALSFFWAMIAKNPKWFWGSILVFLAVYSLVVPLNNWFFRQREKAKQEFFRLHPEYAEIIKKAEAGT